MFDLKPNQLSPEEQLAVDQFSAENEKRLDDLVISRMRDPDHVAEALQELIRTKSSAMDYLVNLVIGFGDKGINIANIKLDCMDWIREQIVGAGK